MPELPEVETVVRYLHSQLPGLQVTAVRARRERLRTPLDGVSLKQLLGQTFTDVGRRGKWIILNLDRHDVLVHLGMTGRIQVLPRRTSRAPHCHVVFSLQPGDLELRFSDPRRFGALLTLPAHQAAAYLRSRLGPEPFDITSTDLYKRLSSTTRSVKTALMDQRVLAGLGNIYTDEALYQARIFPTRPAHTLTRSECARLLMAIRQVLHRAIECRGSSIRDYMFGTNGRGTYQQEFLVYSREGQPCRRCRRPIQRVRLANRSCYYCPSCQADHKA